MTIFEPQVTEIGSEGFVNCAKVTPLAVRYSPLKCTYIKIILMISTVGFFQRENGTKNGQK